MTRALMKLALFALWLAFLVGIARAQEHQHTAQDMELHAKFYSTWNVPNGGNPRVSSCCNLKDCAPADTKFENGHWYGRRRADPSWIMIPDRLIESNQGDPRESPDGASHICVSASGTVLCAVLGGGT